MGGASGSTGMARLPVVLGAAVAFLIGLAAATSSSDLAAELRAGAGANQRFRNPDLLGKVLFEEVGVDTLSELSGLNGKELDRVEVKLEDAGVLVGDSAKLRRLTVQMNQPPATTINASNSSSSSASERLARLERDVMQLNQTKTAAAAGRRGLQEAGGVWGCADATGL